jgi:hypothetical protein
MNFINKTTSARCAPLTRPDKARTNDRPMQPLLHVSRRGRRAWRICTSQVFLPSPRRAVVPREVSTVGFSKARRAKVPPPRRDGNTFVFGFQELHCCRARLALFAPITPSWKFKTFARRKRGTLPLTGDTYDELINEESTMSGR